MKQFLISDRKIKIAWVVSIIIGVILIFGILGSISYLNHKHLFRSQKILATIAVPHTNPSDKMDTKEKNKEYKVLTPNKVTVEGFSFNTGNWILDFILGLAAMVISYFLKRLIDWYFKQKELRLQAELKEIGV